MDEETIIEKLIREHKEAKEEVERTRSEYQDWKFHLKTREAFVRVAKRASNTAYKNWVRARKKEKRMKTRINAVPYRIRKTVQAKPKIALDYIFK